MGNPGRTFATAAALALLAGRLLACSSDETTPVGQADAGNDTGISPLFDGSSPDSGAPIEAGSSSSGEVPTLDASTDADAAGKDCKLGTDFEGLCICNKDAYVQPNGLCGATPPGNCAAQGGECTPGSGDCPSGGIVGTKPASLACGDFAPTRCCFATCKGPNDFVCCPTSGGSTALPIICENGYRTCMPDSKPVHGSTCP